MPDRVTKSSSPLLAVVLAWLVPGAGHFYLGRKIRGAIIFVVIGATFWGGVAMGGVLTMDFYNYSTRWWFIGQMFTGAHGIYGWQRQKAVYDPLFDRLAQEHGQSREYIIQRYMVGANASTPAPADTELIGEVDSELQKAGVALAYQPTENAARAFSGVAGMLNLLCIIDAMMLSLMGAYSEPPPAVPAGKEAE